MHMLACPPLRRLPSLSLLSFLFCFIMLLLAIITDSLLNIYNTLCFPKALHIFIQWKFPLKRIIWLVVIIFWRDGPTSSVSITENIKPYILQQHKVNFLNDCQVSLESQNVVNPPTMCFHGISWPNVIDWF